MTTTTTMTTRLLLLILAVGPLLPPLLAQQTSPAASAPAPTGVYQRDDLQMHYYRAVHAEAHRLAQTLAEFYRRPIDVVDESGAPRTVPNIAYMNDTVVIYETPALAERLLAEVRRLDQTAQPESGAPARLVRDEELATLEYTPRHVSVDTLRQVAQTFFRTVTVPTGQGTVNTSLPTLAMIEDSRRLILRDVPERLEEIRGALERADVARPQVTVSCWVLRATRDPSGASPGLPEELAANLSALVPFQHFAIRSIGVLRTSVAPRESMSLEMTGVDEGERYLLRMAPEAYDPEQGVLALRNCMFEGSQAQSFSTSTSLRRGEYTVLGGVGAEPVFVVLQIPEAR